MVDVDVPATNAPDPRGASVLGLGPMGVAMAQALAAAGHRVVAWNRTPRGRAELGLDQAVGVELRPSPELAVAAVDGPVLVCVRDHAASRAILERIGSAATGRVVVNVSTGTPTDTTESARHAQRLGLRYVTGAVMVPTAMVGTERCLVLYAGAAADLEAAAPVLRALGGVADVVGDDHAVPPALDLAMLDVYFAGMYAFFHAAALAAAHGIAGERFLPHAEGIVDTLRHSLPDLSRAIAQRTYDGGQARLDMCRAFLEHIVATSRDAGIDPGVAALVRDASARAMARRPGSTDWDVVAEDFRPRSRATA